MFLPEKSFSYVLGTILRARHKVMSETKFLLFLKELTF